MYKTPMKYLNDDTEKDNGHGKPQLTSGIGPNIAFVSSL